MKTIIAILFTVFLLIPNQANANEMLAETICSYIEVDNKSRLRKVLKANNVRIRNIYETMTCDGQSMLHFAISSEANSVGGFIVSKLPVAMLAAPLNDGKTLLKWAEEFGYTNSPVITVAKDRIGE